jgi:phage/plasmid-like protein (TIGR03299 family)
MHQIELFSDGTAAFASRLDAWHRLGTITGECMTGEQVMDKAKLGGWNVRKVSLTATEITSEGVDTLKVPDKYATVRTHPVTGAMDYLGTVGNIYTIQQNEEQVEVLDALVEMSGAKHFETAGSLCGGRQTFVTMRVPQTMRVAGIDALELYIAALNSHNGSSNITIMITPIRVVCANTQRMAIENTVSSFHIRHTKNGKVRLAQIRHKLGLMWKYAEAFEREAEKLINAELSTVQFKQIIRQLWPVDENETSVRTRNNHDRRTGRLLDLWDHAATQQDIRGTRWAGLQAITEYLDHYTPAKNDMVRAHRVLTSTKLTDYKQQAYELLTV